MFLTFSRTVIAVFALALAAFGVVQRRKSRDILVLTGIVAALFTVVYWPHVLARATIRGSDEAVQQRIDYARDALSTGGGWHLNITGVGIGGFVPWLMHYNPKLPDYLYQPAHSLPLLAYAETGIIGIIAWVVFMVVIGKRSWRTPMGMLAAALVIISLTDHFFWTLQQGRILWWLVLALAAG